MYLIHLFYYTDNIYNALLKSALTFSLPSGKCVHLCDLWPVQTMFSLYNCAVCCLVLIYTVYIAGLGCIIVKKKIDKK